MNNQSAIFSTIPLLDLVTGGILPGTINMITSNMSGQGTTFLGNRLAESYANQGINTLLINCEHDFMSDRLNCSGNLTVLRDMNANLRLINMLKIIIGIEPELVVIDNLHRSSNFNEIDLARALVTLGLTVWVKTINRNAPDGYLPYQNLVSTGINVSKIQGKNALCLDVSPCRQLSKLRSASINLNIDSEYSRFVC